MNTGPTNVVVFDLDDTLYLERDYVASGFAAAGRYAAHRHGIDGLEAAACSAFEAGRRGDIFDVALTALGFEVQAPVVVGLIRAYRNHRPQIRLAPDAADWLTRVPPGTALALLTDGNAISQSNKVAALGLTRYGFRPVVITARLGRGRGKPHPLGYNMIEKAYRLPPERFTYVADNATKDFLAPRRMGWHTVQIVRPERLHQQPAPDRAHEADTQIGTLAELRR